MPKFYPGDGLAWLSRAQNIYLYDLGGVMITMALTAAVITGAAVIGALIYCAARRK